MKLLKQPNIKNMIIPSLNSNTSLLSQGYHATTAGAVTSNAPATSNSSKALQQNNNLNVVAILRNYIQNATQNNSSTPTTPITTTPITSEPIPEPLPTDTTRILTIDFNNDEQVKYDLDNNGRDETLHSDVTAAGIKIYGDDNTEIQVNKIKNDFDELSSQLQIINNQLNNKSIDIDGLYLSLGYDMNIEEIKSFFEVNIDLDYLSTGAGKQAMLDIIKTFGPNHVLNKIFDNLQNIQTKIPVYTSAGNDPDSVNLLAFVPGNNIHIIGTPSNYSSQIYDRTIQSDYQWTKRADGWDIDGNGDIELPFSDTVTEGKNLANGTKVFIEGGTSLGVAIALGQALFEGVPATQQSAQPTQPANRPPVSVLA